LSKKKYEKRFDKVTNHNGQQVDLAADVELFVDAANYIRRRSNAAESAKFVSKYLKPSKEARDVMAKETESVLLKLSKLHGIVPADNDNFNRAIWLLAQNFLYEFEGGQISFAKLSESGLTSSRRFSFDELVPGVLINHERTSMAGELKTAELKSLAKKLLDGTTIRKETIEQKVEVLKKQELLAAGIPEKKLPSISRSDIEKETIRREATIRGFNPDDVFAGGGQRLADLQRISKREYEQLDDVTEITNELKKIKPRGPAQYEGISYE